MHWEHPRLDFEFFCKAGADRGACRTRGGYRGNQTAATGATVEQQLFYADLFIRICDVDPKGRPHNISDAFVRLDPLPDAGEVRHLTLRLSPCAHRMLKGHRLRLLLSGGAHPQYARNLGTGEPLATGASLKPACHTIHHADTRLTLPITSTP